MMTIIHRLPHPPGCAGARLLSPSSRQPRNNGGRGTPLSWEKPFKNRWRAKRPAFQPAITSSRAKERRGASGVDGLKGRGKRWTHEDGNHTCSHARTHACSLAHRGERTALPASCFPSTVEPHMINPSINRS
ncbi:unnamed protein product [Pylaiella littoralis]